MSVVDISDPEAVLQAIAEFDNLGRDAFLGKYGFGGSRKYSISHNGRQYDSKPILAAAHGYQYPTLGPLHPRDFNGGTETIRKLYTLGFATTSASSKPDFALSAADSALFARYPTRVRWNAVDVLPDDQAEFRGLRNRLKTLTNWLTEELAPFPVKPFVSSLNPNGRTPRDLWCCIFSKDAPNKSYALQIALIVADDGVEICLCLGAGESQLSGRARVESLTYLASVQDALHSVPADLVAQVQTNLPNEARYLTSWRDPYAEPAFDDLRQWLDHAAGPEGPQAAISVHYPAHDLDTGGHRIADTFYRMACAALPIVEFIEAFRTGSTTPSIADGIDSNAVKGVPFTWQGLRQRAQESAAGLELDDEVYRATVAALESGKHIIFTGAPGTAKTTLAEIVGDLAQSAGKCNGYTLTTATADWTTYETIGGLHPKADASGGLEFQPGHFLEAISGRRWLIIDELNRSNFDRAFGQMFSVLAGQSVILPYHHASSGKRFALAVSESDTRYDSREYHVLTVPDTWRILATMNVFDKSLLFEMSYALMRRFAFIEVRTPTNSVYEDLWLTRLHSLNSSDQEKVSGVLRSLLAVRNVKDVGPAIFIDMARFAATYIEGSDTWSTQELTFQLFFSYLLPQFEGLSNAECRILFDIVRNQLDTPLTNRLQTTLTTVLGMNLAVSGLSNASYRAADDRD